MKNRSTKLPVLKNSFWPTGGYPLAIAHRGGAGAFSLDRAQRENTLKVFKTAVEAGFEYLEMDVTNTADNKVIVLHVTADRFEALLHKPSAPDAKHLQQYTYDSLKKRLGREIPTLREVLSALPKTKFLIDAKTDEVIKPLANDIKLTNSKNRVYLNSFFQSRISELQKLLGKDLNCGVIIGRHPRLINSRLRALQAGNYFDKGYTAITIPRRFLTKDRVDLIHDHQLKVLVWAPNTESQIKRAIKLGVDGIISDDIMTLKNTLSSL